MPILERWRRDVEAAAPRDRSSGLAGTLVAAAGAALAGAAAAFLLDPDRGNARRSQLVDRIAAAARSGRRRGERAARGVGAGASAMVARTSAALRERPERDENDAALASRVESELFSDPSIPKGSLNLNAENGIIVVRGEVADADMRERIETAIRRVPGVWEVNNLVHLPGEPAPTAR